MEQKMNQYYQMTEQELILTLQTNPISGLTEKEAKERLAIGGENVLSEEEQKTVLDRIGDELKSPLVFILLLAGIFTSVLGEYVDATVIFIALIVNIAINLYQEGRASRAFFELKHAQSARAIVIRDGVATEIETHSLVRGDVVLLQSGNTVPADIRIIHTDGVEVNESVLTGEWVPVSKQAATLTGMLSRVEQINMLYMGTLITSGSVRGLVVETGDKTVFGGIGISLKQSTPPLTPMQKNMKSAARFLTYVVLFAVVVVACLGLYRGVPFSETLLISIAIAVAAIPEGLPAVVSVMLAISMQRILKKGGLVRNLLAAETLGSTTVIMTDKTGTLTEGVMRLERVISYNSLDTDLGAYNSKRAHEEHGDERDVLSFAYLATNVIIEKAKTQGLGVRFHGRPVDAAITQGLYGAGVSIEELEADFPRKDSLPFSSEKREAYSLNGIRGLEQMRLFVLGAPEDIIEHSYTYYADGKTHPMDGEKRARFHEKLADATQRGMRVVAVGYAEIEGKDNPSIKDAMGGIAEKAEPYVFCGLILLSDPLRAEVRAAIVAAKVAGVRVIMATGDGPNTARAIAHQAGIVSDAHAPVLLGSDVASLDDGALLKKLASVSVFARMLPEQKQRIAVLLESMGDVVAMTGDGVNDAPSLRAASIGLALGSGTDVAKEASDIVLVENSFSVITAAIEEGRRALDNIKKSIIYLLSTSFSEIIVVIVALGLGMPLPLLPAQIIWTNMLTEGLMNFAFGFEEKEKGLMTRDPRVHGAQHMFTSKFIAFIVTLGGISGGILVVLYVLLQQQDLSPESMRTIMFVSLTLITTLMAFTLRRLESSLFTISLWTNKYLLLAFGVTVSGLLCALYVPYLSRLLQLDSRILPQFVPYVMVSIVTMFFSVEIAKKLFFRSQSS